MENRFISLLYPSLESYTAHRERRDIPAVSEQVCQELGLVQLLGLRSAPTDFFTADPSVIEYRQRALSDLDALPSVRETLSLVIPALLDITELRKLRSDVQDSSGDFYLYSITEVELYVRCITVLNEGLAPVFDKLGSEAFRSLASLAMETAGSDYYKELTEGIAKLSRQMVEVRSITVGVNLDGQLRPSEAGVISINAERFKSGSTLDKILRMSFKNDAMTCIANLTPFGKGDSDNRKDALVGAFHSAIEDVFRSSVRGWRSIVSDYVLENTDDLLRILPEIELLQKAAALVGTLRDRGYRMTMPHICPMEEKAFRAIDLYNPDVALRISERIVTNDFSFDQMAGIYVITGPNRGGKSVHTCAVGLAQAMTQLGMPVCAEEAEISPVDRIETHFPQGADDTIDKGRLGEECARLRTIFEHITSASMVLLDESLSSTGAFEASYIASDVLMGLALVGCRCVFSTHLHELAALVPTISQTAAERGGCRIDTLTAEIGEGGGRSFRVVRARPDGKSYAKDIAQKYGLGMDQILSLIGDKVRR